MARFKIIKGNTRVYIADGEYFPIGATGGIIEVSDSKIVKALRSAICVAEIEVKQEKSKKTKGDKNA